MLDAQRLAVTMLLASRPSEEDIILLGVAGLLFVLSIAALALGISFHKKKKGGLAVLLIVAAAALFLGCLGLSALAILAQAAWH